MKKKMKSDKKQNKGKLWLGTALLRDHNYIYLSDPIQGTVFSPHCILPKKTTCERIIKSDAENDS